MAEMIGKIIERDGKKIFVPLEAAPWEEDIFPKMEGVERTPAGTVTPKPLPKPITTARLATQAAMASRRGIITTREGSSIAKEYYHRKSYIKDFVGKSRVEFGDTFGDTDGLISNFPEPFFKTEALITGVRLEIEPPILKDVNSTYGYVRAIQVLYNAIFQIKLNDGLIWSASLKDLAPQITYEMESDGTNVYDAISFHPAKAKLLGDRLRTDFIKTSEKDKVTLVIVSLEAFPSLGSGATDFYIKPILRARQPQRITGG